MNEPINETLRAIDEVHRAHAAGRITEGQAIETIQGIHERGARRAYWLAVARKAFTLVPSVAVLAYLAFTSMAAGELLWTRFPLQAMALTALGVAGGCGVLVGLMLLFSEHRTVLEALRASRTQRLP